jgi:hypothetical protein
MKQYLFEHARFPAQRFGRLLPEFGSFCKAVEQDKLPEIYCKTQYPERMLPIVWSPDDFMITVSGDPDRDNCLLCAQNGFIGYPVSKKISLPSAWKDLLKKSG